MSTNNANEEAAWWVYRISGPYMSDAEHAQFRAWVQDPKNAKEFRIHHRALLMARELPGSVCEPLLLREEHRGRRRPIAGILLGTAAAVLVALFLAWLLQPKEQTYTTRTGEVRAIHLPDGSTATLDTRSRIQVHLTRTERHVNLIDGRALFDIHSDPRHPFIVEVGPVRIRVLGTEFDVYRQHNKATTLTVLRGSVEVSGRSNTSTQAWTRHLEADQTLTFGLAGVISDLQAVRPQQRITWPSHIFEARNVPLSAVVDELTRYTDTNIVLADERLNGISIVATLHLGDVRQALRDLQGIVPIQVDEGSTAFILHYHAQPTISPVQQGPSQP
jgi:transmembrane sensor